MTVRKLIEEYLKEARLMQLATSVNNQPWVCSVWFAPDKELNIYWISSETRRHSQEVLKNNRVARAIVLPQTPQDKPRGLQFQGVAEELSGRKEILNAIALYVGRGIFSKEKVLQFMKDSETPHRFYRIKPTQFVLFDAVHFPNNARQELRL